MSEVAGTIIVIASIIILLCPWISEEIKELRWK